MKKTILLAIFLLFSIFAFARPIQTCPKKLINRIDTATASWYIDNGERRSSWEFMPYVSAAYDVAQMIPIYPSTDRLDRTDKYFAFGAKESGFKEDKRCLVNIPGATYLNGRLQVKRLSVDWFFTGVNEINLNRCYIIASCMQNKQQFPKWLHLNSKLEKRLKEECFIPRDLKLTKINHTGTKTWVTRQYSIYKKCGMTPNQIRNQFKLNWREQTRDDVRSAIIYRVIVELERQSRGQSYLNYHVELYNYLKENVKW